MRKKKNIFQVEIAKDECKGCGRCVHACPHGVLKMEINYINAMGLPYAEYAGSGCTGCGACFYTCPEPGAITILEISED